MTSLPHTFRGSCHCGALGLSFETALPVARWSVRACSCRFCRAHAALTTSDPSGRLIFHAREAQALQRYRFGLKSADFLLCGRCGVYLGAQTESAHAAFGIINTRALMPPPDGLPVAVMADYSSETAGERLARRAQRWTPLARVI